MVSVQDLYEAKQALKGGADIVDVKNLQEALVGSAHPNVVKQIRDEVPSAHHASVTLGVVPDQNGTVAMAVYAAGPEPIMTRFSIARDSATSTCSQPL